MADFRQLETEIEKTMNELEDLLKMKKNIIEYLRKNKSSDIHQISKALNIDEFNALRAVNELLNDGYVTLCTPVPLSEENSSSVRYKLTGKEFIE